MCVFIMAYISDWNIGHIFKIDDRCQLLLTIITRIVLFQEVIKEVNKSAVAFDFKYLLTETPQMLENMVVETLLLYRICHNFFYVLFKNIKFITGDCHQT